MASAQRKLAQGESAKIIRVGEGRYPKAKLIEPTHSGYILTSAEVDRSLGLLFLPNSRKKRRLIAECKEFCRCLTQDPNVLEAVVFHAIFITPGEDKDFLEKRRPVGRFPNLPAESNDQVPDGGAECTAPGSPYLPVRPLLLHEFAVRHRSVSGVTRE